MSLEGNHLISMEGINSKYRLDALLVLPSEGLAVVPAGLAGML